MTETKDKLKVNEIFGPTIQGEGKTSGKEVLFLRLSGCNLHCIWCDTPYTWNWEGTSFKHPKKYDRKKEEHEYSFYHVWRKLIHLDENGCQSLVVSGGEPLIQQKVLARFLKGLKAQGWYIEVETNGTIAPTPELDAVVDQFNCSPKLSNSDNPEKSRIRKKAMEALSRNKKVYFKFVVSSEKDISEIEDYVCNFELNPDHVYLMPLGMTKDELKETRENTKALAKKLGLHFSDRLHVEMFGGKRGV